MAYKQIFKHLWQRIEIEISFKPDYCMAYKDQMGASLSHIGIKAGEPLPITRTAYRSVFLSLEEVEKAGGVILLVQKWLDEYSQSEEWKQYRNAKMQLSLF